MARHLTRARLTRSVAGLFSALAVSATALFAIARHLAG